LILASQKVSADSILSKGFVFKFPLLSQALDDLINKKE
jgi:NAD dependent epimerase/dehydratase family enzyme